MSELPKKRASIWDFRSWKSELVRYRFNSNSPRWPGAKLAQTAPHSSHAYNRRLSQFIPMNVSVQDADECSWHPRTGAPAIKSGDKKLTPRVNTTYWTFLGSTGVWKRKRKKENLNPPKKNNENKCNIRAESLEIGRKQGKSWTIYG